MDLLTGYESEDEQQSQSPCLDSVTAVMSTAAPHCLPPPAHPAPAMLAAAAAETITPDSATQLPPGEIRVHGARSESAEEKKVRKEAKAAKKAAKAAAAPSKPKLVLPSATALMAGVGATAMGLAGSGNEADTEGSPPLPTTAGKKKYNALPPPASLLAGDQLSEEAQWRMKPLQVGEKRRFTDIPPAVAPVPATQTQTQAQSAAPTRPLPPASGGGAAGAHARFAPPQVTRKQANVTTEDSSNWSAAKRRSTGVGSSPNTSASS